LLHPKKVGTLPVSDQEVKRTNEIKTAIPLLDAIDIQGKEITADALLTQRKIADYLVRKRKAHYHFTVKNNQPGLFQDIALYFNDRQEPDFVQCDPPDHGRIEIRKIWTTSELNGYLNFPHVGQAFVIQREFTDKKTGKYSCEIAYGITSRTAEQADPQRVLATNRGHWCIENSCHYIIDWNYHEDAAGYKPAMARKISRACAALPLASSNPKGCAASRRKCDSSCSMYAWSLTICG
jgi:predicted transposase YbfD/YdcC